MGPWSHKERAATCCAAWWRLRISSITVTHLAPMLPNCSILFKHVCASRRFTRLTKTELTDYRLYLRQQDVCSGRHTHTASVSTERWLQKHWGMKHFFTSGFGDINKLVFRNCSNKSFCFKKVSMAWDHEEILLKSDIRFHERSSLGVLRWVVVTWQPQDQTWRWWKQTGPSWMGIIPRQLLWYRYPAYSGSLEWHKIELEQIELNSLTINWLNRLKSRLSPGNIFPVFYCLMLVSLCEFVGSLSCW